MRVRELLAASAICLLVLACAGCERVDQSIGVYEDGRAAELPRPPSAEPDAPTTDLADAAAPLQPLPPWPASDAGPDAGAVGRPSTWLPPMLGDAAMDPPTTVEPGGCGMIEPELALRRRLDMYIVMDSNITLPATGLWEKTTEGFEMFVNDNSSQGLGVGIKYFGLDCDPGRYANADVEVNLLPANADSLSSSTTMRRLNASPMLPALQGGLIHAKARARAHPDWKQIVVLVSDGFTQDFTCPYSVQDMQNAASLGWLDLPSVETHIVGVGVTTSVVPLDEWITRFGSFDGIAAAGGSEQALTTGIMDDSTAFSEQLHTVRRKAQPCDFAAPQDAAIDDFGMARWGVGDEVPRVANERACRGLQGWFYKASSDPYPVTACEATCQWLRESDNHLVVMLPGCPASTRN